MFLKILTVAGLATFEIYAAIPAGFAFGLSSVLIFLASLTGGLAGAVVSAFFGDKIRAFFHKKKPTKSEEKKTPGHNKALEQIRNHRPGCFRYHYGGGTHKYCGGNGVKCEY
ncbi:MAG: hypothetical protein IPN29_22065 [Saprospiraceae bacterium]|nr:hypothetical protein [Saprospiraceae bacterium]